jgi:hydrogenase nickel incorporation protein HypA/HybF
MSVCQALLVQITQIAHEHRAAAVERITIAIGPLSGIDAAQLDSAFRVMRRGSVAAAAELVVDSVDIRIRCEACGGEAAALINRLTCSWCGGFRTRVIQGDELRLMRVELCVPADA